MFSQMNAGGIYAPPAFYMPAVSTGNIFLPYSGSFPLPLYSPFPRFVTTDQFTTENSPYQPRKLFIGGLNHETTDQDLHNFYSQWGDVVDCIVIRDPQTKCSRGFGFVTFASVHMAEAAMANKPHMINGKLVDSKPAIPREQMSGLLINNLPPFLEGDIEPEPGCKLFLSGIYSSKHSVDILRRYFAKFGTVEQIEVLGNPKGFGFVIFEHKSEADSCLAEGKVHNINGYKCEVTQNPIQHSVYQEDCICLSNSDETEADELCANSNTKKASPQEGDHPDGQRVSGDFLANCQVKSSGTNNLKKHRQKRSTNVSVDASSESEIGDMRVREKRKNRASCR